MGLSLFSVPLNSSGDSELVWELFQKLLELQQPQALSLTTPGNT